MQATDLCLGPPPFTLVANASLFLDFDGTLVDLVDRPDEVTGDPELRSLLDRLSRRFHGRVGIVSGRSIAQIDAMLGPVAADLAVAGSHGAELRLADERSAAAVPPALASIGERMAAFAALHPGVLVERKTLGAALHFRQAPEHEEAAIALAKSLAEVNGLYLQHGKMMVEVRADGDKGAAVTALAASAAMAGTRPLVFGDDLTDEAGFVAAAALGGAGVLVGSPRETTATYALPDFAAVRAWLAQAAEARA